jgi:polysaccharide biosynthesis/export protein
MRIFAAVALVLSAALSPPLAAQSSRVTPGMPGDVQVPAVTVLRPGDMVRITVWRKPDLSGDFAVTADSLIGSPFYMDIRVAGIPLPTVAERVRAHVALFESDPRVLVEPLLRFSVSGEVRQPNLYSAGPATTVSQAVMQAGGPTMFANLQQVVVWRGGDALKVDLTRPDIGVANTAILSGDQIVVPRRVSVMRDYIAPAASIIGAAAAVTNIILRRW